MKLQKGINPKLRKGVDIVIPKVLYNYHSDFALCHSESFILCHSERSEESRRFTQEKLREGSLLGVTRLPRRFAPRNDTRVNLA